MHAQLTRAQCQEQRLNKMELAEQVLGTPIPSIDFALPQDWLNAVSEASPIDDAYEILRSGCVMSYEGEGCFGTIVALTVEAQSILDEE